MKKITLILLLLLIPLTLASETQHRFKVYVDVGGDDEQANNTIEAHLKRELRLLGDVDIVGRDGDWKYIINVFHMNKNFKDGTKTGWITISYYHALRFGKSNFTDSSKFLYDTYQPVFGINMGAAHYPRDDLPELCIRIVNSFDKNNLQGTRKLFKDLNQKK